MTIATFLVPNPLPGPFPEWKSLPLPQKQTNGPLVVTLTALKEYHTGRETYLNPKCENDSSDPAWTNHTQDAFSLEDATGNHGNLLSPREPVWKIHYLTYRQRPQDFAANEQFVLTNLALLVPGNYLPIDQKAERGGVGINVQVLAGTGQFGISNGITRFMLPHSLPGSDGGHSTSSTIHGTVETWNHSTPFLLVEVRNTQAEDEIQFHIRDDSGRDIEGNYSSYSGSGGGTRVYELPIHPAKEAKSISVQILVNHPLSFYFLVNPADVRPAK